MIQKTYNNKCCSAATHNNPVSTVQLLEQFLHIIKSQGDIYVLQNINIGQWLKSGS